MKTAATGDVLWVEQPKTVSAEKDVRLKIAIRSDKAKEAVGVCLDLSDSGLCYLLDQLKTLGEKRAKAHNDAAARIRATIEGNP